MIYELSERRFLELATYDCVFDSIGKKYRPDVCYYVAFYSPDLKTVILFEFDEHGHADRPVESEQRKVINEVICCANNGIQYVHLIRVNGGSRRDPDPKQVRLNAEILCDELFQDNQAEREDIATKLRESPREIYVRVTLIDFYEHHHHVKAYDDRLIPHGLEVRKLVNNNDEWESLLVYDKVVKKKSGAPLY